MSIELHPCYSELILNFVESDQHHRDSLLVFYAPWDADSMAARRVLDDVSFAFEDHTGLYVAAVNCWNRDGASRANVLDLTY